MAPYLALAAVQVLFGLFPVAAKAAFEHLDPLALLSVRIVGAALLLALLHPLLVRNPVRPRAEWRKLSLLALLGVVLNTGLFMVGLERTTAINAVLVITSVPVFTYGIAAALGKEPWGPRRALGIGLALAGVLYLVGLSSYDASWSHAAGDLMVLGNAFSFAAFLVLAKPLMHSYDPFSVTAWVFGLGALAFLPLVFFGPLVGQAAAMPASGWWLVAFIVVGCTVLTYTLNSLALRHVPASTVALFIYFQPIVTAVAAALFLDEFPTWKVLPAAALVFAGVFLVVRKRPRVLEGQVMLE